MGKAPVFQVVDSLRTGGAERMAVHVSNGLAGRGWEVHLFATRELGPLASEVDDAVRLRPLARQSRWDVDGLRAFRRAVVEDRPSVVHCHGWSTLQFVTAVLVTLRRPPKLILHDHHPRSAPMSWAHRATAWLCTGAHLAVDEKLLSPPLRTRRKVTGVVVTNGVPLSRFSHKSSYELAEEPKVVALANLRPPKGHHVLLRAVASLRDAGVTVQADLVGAPSDEAYVTEVRALGESLGLEGQVRELGLRPDVADLLPGYDVGVVPSLAESGPLVLIEYLASGLPFVTTDTGAIPAALPPGLRTWVVPTGDPPALADKLGQLLALPAEQRRDIGTRSVEFAARHLSIDRALDAIEDVYRSLIGR